MKKGYQFLRKRPEGMITLEVVTETAGSFPMVSIPRRHFAGMIAFYVPYGDPLRGVNKRVI